VHEKLWTGVALLAWAAGSLAGNTGTDPAAKYAWGENVGWADAAPASNEVTVYFDGTSGWLSGYAWGENVGWIRMGGVVGGPYANTTSNNWGVNLAAGGRLSGYAWGENVGWINFGDAQCDAAINPATGEFSGYAWGENIGWLSFKGASPDYGVRTLAFDTQAMGTPNWWLYNYDVAEDYDAGDGVAAWKKYVMDVDPTVTDNGLRITAVSNAASVRAVSFTPTSARRYYTLSRSYGLVSGRWLDVAGQTRVAGFSGEQTLVETNEAARSFYRVRVSVAP
jgi:hypothetical protein